jgi:rsbT co-antagonist protein RsbR
VLDFVHPESRELALSRMRRTAKTGDALPVVEEKFFRLDGTTFDVEIANQAIIYEGEPAVQVIFADVSERKRAEEATRRVEATEHALQVQEETVRALSSPIIPFGQGLLLMPLIGRINQGRATRIIEALAEGVVAQRARVAILDVTGVPEMDADIADALQRTARVVELLGARVIVTGIQPAIAKVLVDLGVGLSRFEVAGTLREGIAKALRMPHALG